MPDSSPYNPLDYANVTRNVVDELMGREPAPLPLAEKFLGPGVYALFYDGPFEPYSAVRSEDWTFPIYVGKAIPPGSRTGSREADIGHPALHARIGEHVRSINAANNLSTDDFRCRYLTVEPLWITMVERFLIEHYRPLWNACIEGFGLHDPGRGRYQGEISWWDALHPGRVWATRLRQTKTAEDAVTRLREFLADRS